MAVEVTSVHEPRRLPRLTRATVVTARESSTWAHRLGTLLRAFGVLALVVCSAAIITLSYFYYSYSKVVDERLASGYLTSRAGIYAAPRVLRVGQSVSRNRLIETLGRAGYVSGEASDVWSGHFTVEPNAVVIHPRQTESRVTSSLDTVRISFDKQNRITDITGDGAGLASFALEPEALTNDFNMKTGRRAALTYNDIPPVLVRAILAIEDRRFFEHNGLDPVGITRALMSWSGSAGGRDKDRKQGGSTITQQLVKNTYLSPERTLRRKFNEAIIASVLEQRLSKEDIFALYCNEIYLGQRGGVGVRGVAQAAHVFFGRELKDLMLVEAATIAGMIQSPARYAPDRRPEKAKARRDTVLDAMLRDGAITAEQAATATLEPVTVAPVDRAVNATAPYFIDYVNRVVDDRLEPTDGEDGRDLRIETTIDLELQRSAEAAVKNQLEQLEKVYKGRATPQAALVALDPHTGHVLAMVGGADYAASQLNRVTDARRQPGSIFKPFVYAAALEGGFSPLSIFTDAPRVFRYDRRATYRPANYGNAYSMRDVTMRTGLIRSLNVVTVDMAMRVGLARVAALAETFGLPKPEAYPALALGTTEVTPLEIAAAYTPFANGGQLVRPTVVARASDAPRPALVGEQVSATRQVIKPSTAYVVTDTLTGVINQGTGRAARGSLKNTAMAGKTGTSRDGWFVGYTPNLVCVVWVGFDDNEQLGLTGAESALPAWVDFMKAATESRPELGGEFFERPAGVAAVEIDPETGMLASAACPRRERVAVTGGLAPGYECYMHSQVLPTLATTDGLEIYDPTVNNSAATHSDKGGAGGGHPADAALAQPTPATNRTAHQTPTPRAATTVEFIKIPSRPTARGDTSRTGRPKLANEIQVVTSDGRSNR